MRNSSIADPLPVESILFVLNAQPKVWRAMEEFHYRLCCALTQRGVHPVVALSGPVSEPIRDRMASSGATVLVLSYRNKWKCYRALGKVIRQYSIGIVHVRFFNYFQLVPWMVRLHGVRNIVYTEPTSYVSKARGLKRWLRGLRARLTTAPMTRIIAISKFIKNRLAECGVAHDKMLVVYNGVDLQRFSPNEAGRDRLAESFPIEEDEYVLTTIARLEEVKRIDVLLKACKLLKQKGLRFRLFVAGIGPLEGELRALSRSLDLEGHVYWIGQTAEPEIFLQGTDVFLLASEGEAFGNVLVEAMGCGVPVVASRSGAIEELVTDGETGILATPNNEEEFADGIEALLTSPDLRRRFGQAAVARAALFSVDHAVDETLRVYEEICHDA